MKLFQDCLKAIGKNFHPECFNCVYCGKLFGNSPFFLEDGNPYCETGSFEIPHLGQNLTWARCRLERIVHNQVLCLRLSGRSRWSLGRSVEQQLPQPVLQLHGKFTRCINRGDGNEFLSQMCKKNLEGQSFFAKGGRPFCKNHAR